MSRQIQLRRGTAAQHETFTGADGEVTVDTTNKTLRVHDGATPGGTPLACQSALDGADYVVAFQVPTADNNYTWYRKYKSGWVEQGGFSSTGNDATGKNIIFPVKMQNSSYTVSLSIPTSWNEQEILYHVRGATHAPTSITIIGIQQQGQYTVRQNITFTWTVCGMGAS